MNNRGISPLIATVLIIGFTVVLAAIIITWGGRFVTDIQEDVAADTEVSFECSKVDFDLGNLRCTDSTDTVIVAVTSNSNHKITEVAMRVTVAGGAIYSDTSALAVDITPWASIDATFDDLGTGGNDVNIPSETSLEIEVIPTVELPSGAQEICPEVRRTLTRNCP